LLIQPLTCIVVRGLTLLTLNLALVGIVTMPDKTSITLCHVLVFSECCFHAISLIFIIACSLSWQVRLSIDVFHFLYLYFHPTDSGIIALTGISSPWFVVCWPPLDVLSKNNRQNKTLKFRKLGSLFDRVNIK